MKVLLMACAGLVVWGAVSGPHTAGGPPTAATEIPTGGHGSTLLGLLVVVGLLALLAKAGGGRRPVAHTHGGDRRKAVVEHEKAHQRVLRRAGGGGSSRRVWRDRDGWHGRVTPHSWARFDRLPPESQVAFFRGGVVARPDTYPEGDDEGVKWVLSGVPRRDRAWVKAEGDRLARGWAR